MLKQYLTFVFAFSHKEQVLIKHVLINCAFSPVLKSQFENLGRFGFNLKNSCYPLPLHNSFVY